VKLDPRALVGPLAAMLLLALTLQQTLDALQRSGAWGGRANRDGKATNESPFVRIEQELTRRHTDRSPAPDRDPFEYAPTRSVAQGPARPPRPRPIPVAPKPVLTAIIFDQDPRALVRFDGRDYTVRNNTLFAEYRVVRITRDEVVLDKGGESLVLKRPVGGS
jgi:hypothetical protein